MQQSEHVYVSVCEYKPWWAILFAGMEVLLHALVVL